jgi:hypothetical protein
MITPEDICSSDAMSTSAGPVFNLGGRGGGGGFSPYFRKHAGMSQTFFYSVQYTRISICDLINNIDLVRFRFV